LPCNNPPCFINTNAFSFFIMYLDLLIMS
jgi:hypothetical protein